MIINHNMSSMYANRTLGINNDNVHGNIEKLSSGQRINRAGDDASGLAGNVSMLLNESNRFWVAFYDGGVARTRPIHFYVRRVCKHSGTANRQNG